MYAVKVYPYPNPALTSVLNSPRMASIVEMHANHVAAVYRQALSGRGSQNLVNTVVAQVLPNAGYNNDRFVGEVKVGSPQFPYGAADEYGRHAYASYEGSGDLVKALYTVLPYPA